MNLHLLSFNNYYNRQIKTFDTFEEYEPFILDSITNVNFKPNDGTSTQHVVNFDSFDGKYPDYVLLEESNTIVSRWWVIETARLRDGQYRLDLYRDVISDWKTEVINAPSFIEKALTSISDPAIFNSESIEVNQIKQSETLITDRTNCPWLVGYLAKEFGSATIELPPADLDVSYELTSLDGYTYKQYTSENPYFANPSNTRWLINTYEGSPTSRAIVLDASGKFSAPLPDTGYSNYQYTSNVYNFNSLERRGYNLQLSSQLSNYVQCLQSICNILALDNTINWSSYKVRDYISDIAASGNSILAEAGKIIQVTSGAEQGYYRIKVNSSSKIKTATVPRTSTLGMALNTVINKSPAINLNDYVSPCYIAQCECIGYWIELENISSTINTSSVTIPAERPTPSDAPYDVFAIPYGDCYIGLEQTPKYLTNAESAYKLAQALITNLGENLYDVQLLPYCPLIERVQVSSYVTPAILNPNLDRTLEYNLLQDTEGNISSVMFWLNETTFSRTITPTRIQVSDDPIEFKIENECNMYRLASPNYNTAFEFSANKNSGVTAWHVDCAYKPYTPYIRVAPAFGNLYGKVQNDARGLICGGDFSIPQIKDAWVSYQINNKSYADIFARQMENMDVVNRYSRIQDWLNVGSGGISAGATGAMVGSYGGPVGAAAGAVGAAAASTAAGIGDVVISERLRDEAKSYQQDIYGYQLQTVKALPAGLTKVSSFNPNNKIFPVLEFYTCTDTEKQAVRNKIKYNGMTIGRIGTLLEFIQSEPTYMKARLIRIEDIADDFHIINTIAGELSKGVFI